tara:strand:+ start:3202 stop:3666 length:465 start_codon:yes stop_codon:yes gene_type:complete
MLKDYESLCGIPDNKLPGPKEEIQKYLTMSREELKGLNIEDCAEISCRLAQYSIYVQRLMNIERGILKWAEHKILEAVSVESQQYDKFIKHEVKVRLIAKENSHVQRLLDLINYATQTSTRLEYFAGDIKELFHVIIELQRAKTNVMRINNESR